MRKHIPLYLLLIMSLGFLAACSFQNPPALHSSSEEKQEAPKRDESGERDKLRIGYIPGDTTNPFYVSMKFGAEESAEKLGVELIWRGAEQWDYVKQIQIVKGLVAEKVDAIIISPSHATELAAPLQQAMEAGIPVFTVDTNVSDASAYIANVATDNVQGGRNAADILAELIGRKGKVALITSKQGASSIVDRQKGFLEQIRKYTNIEVAATEYSEGQMEPATQKTEAILLGNPDLAGIFATDLVIGTGVAQALKNKQVQDRVKIVSYDASPETVAALRDNVIQAVISQKPAELAKVTMQMAYDYLNGKRNMRKFTVLDNIPVTQESIDLPVMKDFLYRTE